MLFFKKKHFIYLKVSLFNAIWLMNIFVLRGCYSIQRKKREEKWGREERWQFFLRLAAISAAIVSREKWCHIVVFVVGWLLFLPLIHTDWLTRCYIMPLLSHFQSNSCKARIGLTFFHNACEKSLEIYALKLQFTQIYKGNLRIPKDRISV